MKFEQRVFRNEVVNLDGNQYVGCTFVDCQLVYSGGDPPSLINLTLVDTHLGFAGAAENTLRLIKAFAHPASGFQDAVASQLGEIFQMRAEPTSTQAPIP